MNKKKLTSILLFFLFVTICHAGNFQLLQSTEGVDFYYKWKQTNIFDKSSQYILIVKIDNKNTYPVEVTYTVDYFWQGLTKATSEKITNCIKPEEELIVNARKQGFDASIFTNEEIMSEDFIMELSGVDIKKTETCE